MIKKIIFSLCVMGLNINFIFANLDLENFDYKLYNTLPEVEFADEEIKKCSNFDNFLNEATKISQRYHFNEMGVRLIHRHTTVQEDEIMAEHLGEFNRKPALITQNEKLEKERHKPIPSSWIIHNGEYKVFEYSYDEEVQSTFKKLNDSNEDFFTDISALIIKYQFQNLLAPAIMRRTWHSQYKVDPLFLEQSYLTPHFTSVVTHENKANKEFLNSITTAWEFVDSPIMNGCRPVYRCVLGLNRTHQKIFHGHFKEMYQR